MYEIYIICILSYIWGIPRQIDRIVRKRPIYNYMYVLCMHEGKIQFVDELVRLLT